MYPEPYYSRSQYLEDIEDIKQEGFQLDQFLSKKLHSLPVYGINLACNWPLPLALKSSYITFNDKLEKRIRDESVYIYPFHQTHITLLTIVNFKDNQSPSLEQLKVFKMLEHDLIPVFTKLFSSMTLSRELKPFNISVGWPVLSRNAGFLPILNHSEEIAKIRTKAISAILKFNEEKREYAHLLPIIKAPGIIHSTFMRFQKLPDDKDAFISSYTDLAINEFQPSNALISELYLTAEIKPYMIDGYYIHKFKLIG